MQTWSLNYVRAKTRSSCKYLSTIELSWLKDLSSRFLRIKSLQVAHTKDLST